MQQNVHKIRYPGRGCARKTHGYRNTAFRQGLGVRRARFHSSMIDRTLLSKGEDFEDLVDTYVIFITENDKFGKGVPLYPALKEE